LFGPARTPEELAAWLKTQVPQPADSQVVASTSTAEQEVVQTEPPVAPKIAETKPHVDPKIADTKAADTQGKGKDVEATKPAEVADTQGKGKDVETKDVETTKPVVAETTESVEGADTQGKGKDVEITKPVELPVAPQTTVETKSPETTPSGRYLPFTHGKAGPSQPALSPTTLLQSLPSEIRPAQSGSQSSGLPIIIPYDPNLADQPAPGPSARTILEFPQPPHSPISSAPPPPLREEVERAELPPEELAAMIAWLEDFAARVDLGVESPTPGTGRPRSAP
jgi:hypothetical protein